MEIHEPPATYSEYSRLPEDGPRYEIIGGVGYLSPVPTSYHQIVSTSLQFLLYKHVYTAKLGMVFNAPCDVVLSETDVVQPDILFVAQDHLAIVQRQGIFSAPDLVIEILSPSSSRRDLTQKADLYSRYGVREYWIVDPDNRTVDVWVSRDSTMDTRLVVAEEGTIKSEILPGLTVGLVEVFADLDVIANN